MAENPYLIPQTEASAFLARNPVEETAFACNVDPRDHVHVGRLGEPGTRLQARGVLQTHEGGRTTKVYLAAPQLRQLASALLNVADAIDGETPLAFFPPGAPETPEPGR